MNTVKIYTTSSCPYCIRAKIFMDNKGIEYEEVNLTNSPEKRTELSEKYNWRTVPMILINDQLVGGFDDLVNLDRSDRLDDMLSG